MTAEVPPVGAQDLASLLTRIEARLDALEQKLDRLSTVEIGRPRPPELNDGRQHDPGSASVALGPLISVMVVEDDTIYRDGIRSVLEYFRDQFDLVGEASNLEQAAAMVARLQPDVALVDLGIPRNGRLEPRRENGIELIRLITINSPRTRVLVLTTSLQPRWDNLVNVFDALAAGAQGYLVKTDMYVGTEFADAIRRITEGQALIGPSIAQLLIDYFRFGPSQVAGELPPAPISAMPSEPEMKDLEVVAEGAAGAEVGEGVLQTLHRSRDADQERYRQFMDHVRNRS